MAPETTLDFTTDGTTGVSVPEFSQSATEKLNSLLKQNHDAHHIVFDKVGRHNHIVHQLFASYSLGASTEALQRQYNHNASYQRPLPPVDENIISSFGDPQAFTAQMTKHENYNNFLTFFTQQLIRSSVPEVLNEYVFSITELAHTIFNRFFAGVFHPYIHLGYGLEFQQSPIVAEALAQACVSSDFWDEFFISVAEVAKTTQPETMMHLITEMRHDEKLRDAVRWEDDNKVSDGLLVRAKDEMVRYASRWQVPLPAPSQYESTSEYLDEKAAEITNAAALFTGAAQRPPKVVKMDFFYMHSVNSSLFLRVFLQQPWLTDANKAKLLEYTGRLDLAVYASRGCPRLLVDEIQAYPVDKTLRSWEDMFQEAAQFMDDGHTVKFVRALRNGQDSGSPFEKKTYASGKATNSNIDENGTNGQARSGSRNVGDRLQMHGDMWQRMAMMVLDSVRPEYGDRWIRSTGFQEAWEKVPSRSSSQQVQGRL